MKLKADFLSPEAMKANHGVQANGPVQSYVDQSCITYMRTFTPALTGILENSAQRHTAIGSGCVKIKEPYARYQYYGKLMVSSVTGSAYASKGESKILTDIPLQYTTSMNPLAGPFWFERMKAEYKPVILKGARKYARRCK